jgi:probable F420-dependent oxidoreductase
MAQYNGWLGPVGIWAMELRFGDQGEAAEAAAEMDELGYGALWVPGGIDDQVLGCVDHLLASTRRLAIATGIINIWKQPAADVAAWWHAQNDDARTRTMLGIGISHAPAIGADWGRPIGVTRDYLDAMAAGGIPAENICVAALGPKMTALSGERSVGSHPYLTSPEHTAEARGILGPGKLLAPEQGVVLESDPDKARGIAREALTIYRHLPNYCNSWRRLGYSEDDIANLSDRLIDGIFAWGGVEQVAERVKAHHDAGADHVCVQLIRGATGGPIDGLRAAAREMADALL